MSLRLDAHIGQPTSLLIAVGLAWVGFWAPSALAAVVPLQFTVSIQMARGSVPGCDSAAVDLSPTMGLSVDCAVPPVGVTNTPTPDVADGSADDAPQGLVRVALPQDGPVVFPSFGVIDRFFTIRPGLIERELMVAF